MTEDFSQFTLVKKDFNSHPHEEDDRVTSKIFCSFVYFNSHPHEEDDGYSLLFSSAISNFNSHPHEEDDRVERSEP